MGKRKLVRRTVGLISIIAAIGVLVGGLTGCGIKGSPDETQSEPTMVTVPYDFQCFYNENGFKRYDDGMIKSRAGIDVSAYQGFIDWEQVQSTGVEFAFIRLGYRTKETGTINIDEQYYNNMGGAMDQCIDTGVYFFSQAVSKEEAVEEAEFVIDNLQGYELNLPVVFDMERLDEEDRINALTVDEKTQVALAFCEEVEDAGYDVMVYGNTSWLYHELQFDMIEDYDIWLADYSNEPQFYNEYRYWQYTDQGQVPGIDGNVDMNIEFINTLL